MDTIYFIIRYNGIMQACSMNPSKNRHFAQFVVTFFFQTNTVCRICLMFFFVKHSWGFWRVKKNYQPTSNRSHGSKNWIFSNRKTFLRKCKTWTILDLPTNWWSEFLQGYIDDGFMSYVWFENGEQKGWEAPKCPILNMSNESLKWIFTAGNPVVPWGHFGVWISNFSSFSSHWTWYTLRI